MKILATAGLLFYGVANLFRRSIDLATERMLALGVNIALIATGGIVLASSNLIVLWAAWRSTSSS